MKYQYPDKWLRILSYPFLGFFIRNFGEMGTMGELLKTPLYYFDVFFDMLIVVFCWEANRKLILYLDKNYPWPTHHTARIPLQVLVGLAMSFVIVVPMVYLYNEVLTDHGSFNTANLLVMDLPLTLVFVTMVHMIYTGMFFQHHYSETIRQLKHRVNELELSVAGVKTADDMLDESQHRKLLIVNSGSASVPVKTDNIAYIYKQNELSFIRTFDGKEFTSSSSLENLETLLDPKSFFRVNRQVLASQRSIKQFKSDSGGKLQLELIPSLSQETSISKKKAPDFKMWVGEQV